MTTLNSVDELSSGDQHMEVEENEMGVNKVDQTHQASSPSTACFSAHMNDSRDQTSSEETADSVIMLKSLKDLPNISRGFKRSKTIDSTLGEQSRGFHIFNAILVNAELVFTVASHLNVEDLVSLYAISKDFHAIINSRFTHCLLANASANAPESSEIFSFHAYKSLCQFDPAGRASDENTERARMTPSLRWLRMVVYRERIVDEIIAGLAAEGHRLPKEASSTLKKIWFTMEIPRNSVRKAFLHNAELWTDRDLYIATMFFIKLDMRFSDPIDGLGEAMLRKMLLAQKSLSTLNKVLRRESLLNHLEVLRMYVEWRHQPAPEHRGMSIMGVPPELIGKGYLEGWGKGRVPMMRVDELVLMEATLRGIALETKLTAMMLYGHADDLSLEEIESTSTDGADPGDEKMEM